MNRNTLTFADLYRKRVQKVRSSASTGFSLARENISLAKCQQDLAEFAASLENDPSSSLGRMRYMINVLPKQLDNNFMQWLDRRDMDVLQLCIVFNRPDIIHIILENKDMFPESHAPILNPYAHLAASLGFKECLEALLSRRPAFYFKSTQPKHAVRLHKDIQARLKLKEGGSSMNKNVQKMLRKVSESSFNAEKAWEIIGKRSLQEVDILDKEVATLNKPPIRGKPSRTTKAPSVSFDTREAEKQKRSLSNISHRRDSNGNVSSCRQTRTKGEHVITMFRDDLLDEPEGVVKGAGPVVKVVRAQDSRRESISLPSISDVRVLNQRSRSNIITRVKTIPTDAFVPSSKDNAKSMSRFNVSGNKGDISNSAMPVNKMSSINMFKKVEIGVRKIKKYKDFHVVIDSRTLSFKDDKAYVSKTPLTLAAEKGHLNCVKYILQTFVLKQNPVLTSEQPLTLATKARSPESIAILLSGKQSRDDLQSAILTSLREFLPACLTVLLASEKKDRAQLFDGENLLHIFYSQSLNSEYRHEMMPEMTRTLIGCKEDVNARGATSSHPMYTLIGCAFNIKVGKQFLYYLECLKILLSARANPHFNEMKEEFLAYKSKLALSRPDYYSAIQCIFASADRSTNFFEKPLWSKVIMQRFIDCLALNDRTPRRILNDVLFNYMERICQLGLDRRILRSLLRYGANPDFKYEDKYALNKFFDLMLPFLTHFEVMTKVDELIEALMMLCHAMTQECLHEAFVIFLDEHFLHTPLQALSLTRRFCYEVNNELRSPRSLLRLSGQFIWILMRRNYVSAKRLPVDREIWSLILP